ncbi:sulfotransferase family 2 domain-containing protein [Vibrio sp. 10N.286.51.E5]|uniref:sulfotransferase family 2 domain-containing protein n=1 Tax=Vibrio sp. 10N.286.51.E5 TaxID=3229709 RepID=UPI0035516699
MPIVRNDRNQSFLFMHIPKTGGTSIEKTLVESGYNVGFITSRDFEKEMNINLQHVDAEWVIKNGIEQLTDFSFAVVRNPVNRLLSEYRYRCKTSRLMTRFVEFDVFCRFLIMFPDYFNRRFDNHGKKQADYLLEKTYTFKIENGMESLEVYLKNNGFENLQSIGHFNRTRYQHSVFSVSNEVSMQLKEYYSDDFNRFGYDWPESISIGKSKKINSIKAMFLYIYLKIRM